jgi:hypothetical protein
VGSDRLNTIESMIHMTKLMSNIEISKLEFNSLLFFIQEGQKMNKNSNITTQNQIAINRQFENSVRNLTKV